MLLERYDYVCRQLPSCAAIQLLIVRPDSLITIIYYALINLLALIRIQGVSHWAKCKISNWESVEKKVIYLSLYIYLFYHFLLFIPFCRFLSPAFHSRCSFKLARLHHIFYTIWKLADGRVTYKQSDAGCLRGFYKYRLNVIFLYDCLKKYPSLFTSFNILSVD